MTFSEYKKKVLTREAQRLGTWLLSRVLALLACVRPWVQSPALGRGNAIGLCLRTAWHTVSSRQTLATQTLSARQTNCTSLQPAKFSKAPKIYTGKKTACSVNGAGKTGNTNAADQTRFLSLIPYKTAPKIQISIKLPEVSRGTIKTLLQFGCSGGGTHTCNPGSLIQEDHYKFKASLEYTKKLQPE